MKSIKQIHKKVLKYQNIMDELLIDLENIMDFTDKELERIKTRNRVRKKRAKEQYREYYKPIGEK